VVARVSRYSMTNGHSKYGIEDVRFARKMGLDGLWLCHLTEFLCLLDRRCSRLCAISRMYLFALSFLQSVAVFWGTEEHGKTPFELALEEGFKSVLEVLWQLPL